MAMIARSAAIKFAGVLFCLVTLFSLTTFTAHAAVKPLTVDTSVRCSGALSDGWTPTNDGPAGYCATNATCICNAWRAITPTSATAMYHMGQITAAATYQLVVFVPPLPDGTAYVNYDPVILNANGTIVEYIEDCPFSQIQHNIGNGDWATTNCSFTLGTDDIGWYLGIHEWSGQATANLVMSHSAIRLSAG